MGLGSGIRRKPIPDPGSRGHTGYGSRIRIRNTDLCDRQLGLGTSTVQCALGDLYNNSNRINEIGEDDHKMTGSARLKVCLTFLFFMFEMMIKQRIYLIRLRIWFALMIRILWNAKSVPKMVRKMTQRIIIKDDFTYFSRIAAISAHEIHIRIQMKTFLKGWTLNRRRIKIGGPRRMYMNECTDWMWLWMYEKDKLNTKSGIIFSHPI